MTVKHRPDLLSEFLESFQHDVRDVQRPIAEAPLQEPRHGNQVVQLGMFPDVDSESPGGRASGDNPGDLSVTPPTHPGAKHNWTLARRREAEVCEWLRGVLSSGPVPSRELERLAAESGISHRLLWRARQLVGVKQDYAGAGVRLPEVE